jgi:hypothetical protein
MRVQVPPPLSVSRAANSKAVLRNVGWVALAALHERADRRGDYLKVCALFERV